MDNKWSWSDAKGGQRREKTASEDGLRRLQFERGLSDALAGHSPALLGGPYLEGYMEGRAGGTDEARKP